jgi:xanthosine utilization system XapX-like protein
MTHLLAFALGIAVGVVIGLNAVYRQEPPAPPQFSGTVTEYDGTSWTWTA